MDIHGKNVKALYDAHDVENVEKNRSKYEKHRTMSDIIKQVENKKSEEEEFEEDESP